MTRPSFALIALLVLLAAALATIESAQSEWPAAAGAAIEAHADTSGGECPLIDGFDIPCAAAVCRGPAHYEPCRVADLVPIVVPNHSTSLRIGILSAGSGPILEGASPGRRALNVRYPCHPHGVDAEESDVFDDAHLPDDSADEADEAAEVPADMPAGISNSMHPTTGYDPVFDAEFAAPNGESSAWVASSAGPYLDRPIDHGHVAGYGPGYDPHEMMPAEVARSMDAGASYDYEFGAIAPVAPATGGHDESGAALGDGDEDWESRYYGDEDRGTFENWPHETGAWEFPAEEGYQASRGAESEGASDGEEAASGQSRYRDVSVPTPSETGALHSDFSACDESGRCHRAELDVAAERMAELQWDCHAGEEAAVAGETVPVGPASARDLLLGLAGLLGDVGGFFQSLADELAEAAAPRETVSARSGDARSR